MSDVIRLYLEGHNVFTLCSTGPEGPWAAPVFYVATYSAGECRLFFVSNPASRHGQNIGFGARVAGAITEDYGDWPEIRGIQLEGWCMPLAAAAGAEAAGHYLAKFPFARRFLLPDGDLYARAGRGAVFYMVTPSRLYMTDNTADFGRRHRIDFGPTSAGHA